MVGGGNGKLYFENKLSVKLWPSQTNLSIFPGISKKRKKETIIITFKAPRMKSIARPSSNKVNTCTEFAHQVSYKCLYLMLNIIQPSLKMYYNKYFSLLEVKNTLLRKQPKCSCLTLLPMDMGHMNNFKYSGHLLSFSSSLNFIHSL